MTRQLPRLRLLHLQRYQVTDFHLAVHAEVEGDDEGNEESDCAGCDEHQFEFFEGVHERFLW